MKKNNLEFHDFRGNAGQERVVDVQESAEVRVKKVEFDDGRESDFGFKRIINHTWQFRAHLVIGPCILCFRNTFFLVTTCNHLFLLPKTYRSSLKYLIFFRKERLKQKWSKGIILEIGMWVERQRAHFLFNVYT